jgi:hypothetical protein
MSVRHHEELATQLREGEWLKQSLLECSNALHEAIALLRQQHEVNSASAAAGGSGGRSIPSSLTETAAKFNIENISAACKSSIAPPSSGEQLSFLNMCKNGAAAGEALSSSTSVTGAQTGTAGVTATSTTKGATMTLIESLMTSALNADRVLTTLGTGCNPSGTDDYDYGEVSDSGDTNATGSAGSRVESSRDSVAALQLQQLSGGRGGGGGGGGHSGGGGGKSSQSSNQSSILSSMGANEFGAFPFTRGDISSVSGVGGGGAFSTSSSSSLSQSFVGGNQQATCGGEVSAQPSFFKFLQRDSSGTYNLKPSSNLMGLVNKPLSKSTVERTSSPSGDDGINILAAVISDSSGGSNVNSGSETEGRDSHMAKRAKIDA